jgi:hypothetical protein
MAGTSEGTGHVCPLCGAVVVAITMRSHEELCDPAPVRYRDLEWQGLMVDAAGRGYWKCDGAPAGLDDVVGYRLHVGSCERWSEVMVV